ncbi:POK18 protein, partial [Struthidea cinerea]|nr:POK18 protein [Struthidea cinerea]
KFVFTVPAVNNAKPVKRYQWKVLPQDMKNSPTICQWYVTQALSEVNEHFPEAYCYHYMDDTLLAASTQDKLLRIQPLLLDALHSYGLQVAPEKVQQHPPWKYLEVKILDRTTQHQEVQFSDSIKTLNDDQKLLGIINWLRPYLGLTTTQLSPLFNILKGDPELNSPQKPPPEAFIEWIPPLISLFSLPLQIFILRISLANIQWPDPLHILEWVFLPHQPKKTAPTLFELIACLIIKCRRRCLQLMAADPATIFLPVQQEHFEWSFIYSAPLQSALQNFSGQIAYHLPSHKLPQLAKSTSFTLQPRKSWVPVQGPTVFTDGS